MDTGETFSPSITQAGNFCDAHKILGPLCKFLDGEILLSTDELSQYLLTICNYFETTEDNNLSRRLHPSNVSGVYMHALELLRNDPCMADLDGNVKHNIVDPYLDAEKAVSIVYAKTSVNPEHTTRDNLNNHRYEWHNSNDYHRQLRIRSVTNFSACYAFARNEFMKFSDLVVETLEIRLKVPDSDQGPLRAILAELATLWHTLLSNHSDFDKKCLQSSLCFRCDRIMCLMSQLNMDIYGQTATQVWIDALLLLPRSDSPGRSGLHDKEHLINADQYQHDQYTKNKDNKRLREFMAYVRSIVRPILQGTPQRNGRSMFDDRTSPAVRLDTEKECTKVRLINVNREIKSDVKLLLYEPNNIQLQPEGEIHLLFEDIIHDQPEKDGQPIRVDAWIIRVCDESELLPEKGKLLVVKLDGDWSKEPHWIELVNRLNLETAHERRLH